MNTAESPSDIDSLVASLTNDIVPPLTFLKKENVFINVAKLETVPFQKCARVGADPAKDTAAREVSQAEKHGYCKKNTNIRNKQATEVTYSDN